MDDGQYNNRTKVDLLVRYFNTVLKDLGVILARKSEVRTFKFSVLEF